MRDKTPEECKMTDDVRACPFCGSIYVDLHVERLRTSYIRCVSCGAMFQIDSEHCHDPTTQMLVDALIEKWNTREEDR